MTTDPNPKKSPVKARKMPMGVPMPVVRVAMDARGRRAYETHLRKIKEGILSSSSAGTTPSSTTTTPIATTTTPITTTSFLPF